jgi:hypothetical protein
MHMKHSDSWRGNVIPALILLVALLLILMDPAPAAELFAY